MSYRIANNWRKLTDPNTFPRLDEVTIEVCDLIETNGMGTQTRWTDGAHRVKAPGKRARTFKGETAWMDAERLAGDWQSEINQEKRKW